MRKLLPFFTLIYVIITVNAQTSTLIAYYPFTGNAGDSSGYNHHGTVSGATLTSDRFGSPNSAYEFDGINDLISISHSNNLNVENELTLSAWIKPAAFPSSGNVMILGKSNYTTNTNYLLRVRPNGFIQFEYKIFANSSDNPLQLNQWNHIAVTSNSANEKKVFINNVLATHTTSSSPYGLVTNPITIGAAGYSSEYFKGSIDDVRIYKTALSVAEINSLFHSNPTQSPIKMQEEFHYYITNRTLFFKNIQNLNLIKSISVYNITGQEIFKAREITNSIELNTLDKGIYLIRIEKFDKTYSTSKIIITASP